MSRFSREQMHDSLSMAPPSPAEHEFEAFVRERVPLLRRALVARFGVEVGRDATSAAVERAWRDWDRVGRMSNPTGYLFRVGQSAARPDVRWRRRTERLSFPREVPLVASESAIDVFDALRRLTIPQRVAVILVKAHGHSYAEAAEILGVTTAAVTNHVHRGMTALRSYLEASDD